jgi:hypothetical protein
MDLPPKKKKEKEKEKEKTIIWTLVVIGFP